MTRTTTIEVYNLLQKTFTRDEAEKIVTFISEQNENAMEEAKQKFLTKEDKIELINRMDLHFKWLAGIMIATISLAVAVMKL